VSAKIAKAVLESDLEPSLKPTAMTMALFADDTGNRVFPSVGLVAWQLGLQERSVRRNLAKLRALGVLIPNSPNTGGRLAGADRGRSVLYRFAIEALPQRPRYKPCRPRQGNGTHIPDADDRVGDGSRVSSASATLTPTSVTLTCVTDNPDAGVSRSSIDLQKRSPEEISHEDLPPHKARRDAVALENTKRPPMRRRASATGNRPFTERELREGREWFRRVGIALDRSVSADEHIAGYIRRTLRMERATESAQ
jgi:hypothetical protein